MVEYQGGGFAGSAAGFVASAGEVGGCGSSADARRGSVRRAAATSGLSLFTPDPFAVDVE
jgi:hypothetical protein